LAWAALGIVAFRRCTRRRRATDSGKAPRAEPQPHACPAETDLP